MELERCNRCCSKQGIRAVDDNDNSPIVICGHCGFTQPEHIWQLFGWRSITLYPPHFAGSIYVWGKGVGRKEATWDAGTKTCSIPDATHWLRVPDPTKQIEMDE